MALPLPRQGQRDVGTTDPQTLIFNRQRHSIGQLCDGLRGDVVMLAMKQIISRGSPDRSHIDVTEVTQIRHWAKHFNVETEALLEAIDKVGNGVATVRKELGLSDEAPA